jgi:plasmid maintenance system antidote protein VapI
MSDNGMRPIHPGGVLPWEFLEPMGMSVNAQIQWSVLSGFVGL